MTTPYDDAKDPLCTALVAERVGTPTYIYDATAITDALAAYKAACDAHGIALRLCYAVKANTHAALLRLIAAQGAHVCFDVVSGGELERVLGAGIRPDRIVFSGPGKTDEELSLALHTGIASLCVESAPELTRICEMTPTADADRRVGISIRVNPDILADTHPHIATGGSRHKFGVPVPQVPALLKTLHAHKLRYGGLSCHLGSQIRTADPYLQALTQLGALREHASKLGLPHGDLDLGGGAGIADRRQGLPALSPQALVAALAPHLAPLGARITLAPGRSIVASAGNLLTRVVRIKKGFRTQFAVLDAAMNDYARVVLYNDPPEIMPVRPRRTRQTQTYDLVGPICESGDIFCKDWRGPELKEGDLLLLRNVGAYGAVMASNYNSRPRPAEVLVTGGRAHLISQRETPQQLVARECWTALTP